MPRTEPWHSIGRILRDEKNHPNSDVRGSQEREAFPEGDAQLD